jgi:hypothetical protein
MSLLDTASLIVTPNGYKEGKLYSVIPSDGSGDLSVTRATTATRVNSAGLVELVPYNLLTYSEQFDNAIWSTNQVNITTNATISPIGNNTADKIIPNTDSGAHSIYQGVSVTANEFTLSFYAKKAGYTAIRVGNLVTGVSGSFDLQNGVVGSSDAGIVSTILNVGNDWYRCSIKFTATAAFEYYGFYVQQSIGVTSYNGNGTDGIFVWGAQVNEGSLKDYQRTETRLNIPRLDYSNGSCPSLLVEPQRTNVLQRSEQFDNAYWDKYRCDIGINAEVSPSGIQNAETITSSVGETIIPAIATLGLTFSANTRYSTSLFVKKIGTVNTFRLAYVDNVINFAGGSVTFNVVTQAITITQPANNSITASIEDYGNGWYRLVMNFTTIVIPTYNYIEYSIPTVSTTNTFALWGAQLEVGSYPTSYIPTTSASVTRNADVISKTGISSLIGQTEGTLFIDIVFKNPLTSINRFMSITEAGWQADGSIRIEMNTSELTVDIVNNGSSIGAITYLGTFTPNTRYKIAVAYKQNDCQMYFNGINAGSDTSTGVMPTCFQLYLNALGGGFNAPYEASNINAAALWKTRLTNTQLAELTTL